MREHPISKQRYRAGENRAGGEGRVREDEGKQEGMRCREPWLHPSCGLVQKPFVPIVLHNLFSQRLQWEG